MITEFQCNVDLWLTPTDLQPTLVGEKTNEVGLMSDLARVHIYILYVLVLQLGFDELAVEASDI